MSGHPIPARPTFQDLTGKTYGRLTVIGYAGRRRWQCRCVCGNICTVHGPHLKSGNTRSCGCLSREIVSARAKARNYRHGMKDSPEYSAWSTMIDRCVNPDNHAYHNYGGRGVRVCERWRRSFAAFLQDMGRRPSSDHSLDRRDNDGHYEPGNCRWATLAEQAANRRTNRKVTCFGRTLTIAQWARDTGLSKDCIRSRIVAGWPPERALTQPARVCGKGGRGESTQGS